MKPTALLLFIVLNISQACAHKRIYLRDVTALTFYRNAFTTTKRGKAIPELECIGGSAVKFTKYYPSSVQCYNSGFDGVDVQWKCNAVLNNNVQLGHTYVNCEGYDYPNDDYIVAGSCGLEYELDFKGENYVYKNREKFINYLQPSLIIPILLIACFAIWYCCLRNQTWVSEPIGFVDPPSPVEPSAPYPSDPPPSYDDATRERFDFFSDQSTRQRSAPPQPPAYGWRFPGTSSKTTSRPQQAETESSSWAPLTLAAGAGLLGGYLFGASGQNQSTYRPCRSNRDDNDAYTTRSDRHRSSFTERADDDDTYVATSFARTRRR